MTMPLIGNPIAMGQINEELLKDKVNQITLNDTDSRLLVEIFSGQISLFDFYGACLNISNDNGWFSGGGNALTTIQRIVFATDSATALLRGQLTTGRRWHTGVYDKFGAWFIGGNSLNDFSPFGILSSIDKIVYANDTSIAISKGKLPFINNTLSGVTDYRRTGWIGGGSTSTWQHSVGVVSNVTTLTYAIDTAINAYKAPLSSARSTLASVSNTLYGWFGAGFATTILAGWTVVTTIDRITFANDTIAALVRGSLSTPRCDIAAAGNPTDGWFVAGDTTAAAIGDSSRIDKINFTTDSNTALVKAHLPINNCRMAGSSDNNSAAWFAGGTPHTTTYKLTFTNDTTAAQIKGPLAVPRDAMAAT